MRLPPRVERDSVAPLLYHDGVNGQYKRPGDSHRGDSILREFKEFVARGNVMDMAVGIIIGAAFARIVASFVNDVLMPPLGMILGKVDFSNLSVSLSDQNFGGNS